MMDLQKYWKQLKAREQKVIIVGGFLVLVMMVYFLVIDPLANKVSELKASIVDSRQVLTWMNEATEQVKQSQLSTAETSTKNVSLLSLIETTTKASNLAASVSEIKQISDKEVQLIFKTVSFDQLALWLKEIQNKNRIYVNKITLRRTDTLGIVQADLILIRV